MKKMLLVSVVTAQRFLAAFAGIAFFVLAGDHALAQAMRKPGAEEARLGNLAGRWILEGDTEGERYTGSRTCEWFAGGFHLVCRLELAAPFGQLKGQSILGYDAGAKRYTFYMNNSMGNGFFMTGGVNGPVWTWDGNADPGGRPMKARITITEQSPTTHTYTMEASFGGGPWTVLEQGKATKAQQP